MKKIYNRIAEEFYTLEECKNTIAEVTEKDTQELSHLDLETCCDVLNQLNIYDCGTCFYIVDENITYEELLKVIH